MLAPLLLRLALASALSTPSTEEGYSQSTTSTVNTVGGREEAWKALPEAWLRVLAEVRHWNVTEDGDAEHAIISWQQRLKNTAKRAGKRGLEGEKVLLGILGDGSGEDDKERSEGTAFEAVMEIRALFSMSNMLYVIGANLLTAVTAALLHTELIGGSLHSVPAYVTPIAITLVLIDLKIFEFEHIAPPGGGVNGCILVEIATVMIGSSLYYENSFVGAIIPVFAGIYCFLMSTTLLACGWVVPQSVEEVTGRCLYPDYASLLFSVVTLYLGFIGFQDHSLRIVALWSACNSGVWSLPVALWSAAATQDKVNDERGMAPQTRFCLLVYVVMNITLIRLGVEVGTLVFVPYAFIGLLMAWSVLETRAGNWLLTLSPGIYLGTGAYLIILSTGYDDLMDPLWTSLLQLIGRPQTLFWILIFGVRILLIGLGIALITAGFHRWWQVWNEATESSSRIVPFLLLTSAWMGYVLLSEIADRPEPFSIIALLLNGTSAKLLVDAIEALMRLLGHANGMQAFKNRSAGLIPRTLLFILALRAAGFAGESLLRHLAAISLLGLTDLVGYAPESTLGEMLLSGSLSIATIMHATIGGSKIYTAIGVFGLYGFAARLALHASDSRLAVILVLAGVAVATMNFGLAFDYYSTMLEGWVPSGVLNISRIISGDWAPERVLTGLVMKITRI
ncbi:hypothetical protein AAMO2058_000492200 [Amorphochlora amoebiformis]